MLVENRSLEQQCRCGSARILGVAPGRCERGAERRLGGVGSLQAPLSASHDQLERGREIGLLRPWRERPGLLDRLFPQLPCEYGLTLTFDRRRPQQQQLSQIQPHLVLSLRRRDRKLSQSRLGRFELAEHPQRSRGVEPREELTGAEARCTVE